MGTKRFILLNILVSIAMLASAQNGTIKGTVIDAKSNETLIGASVYLEGTTIGTITDFDGNFIVPKIPAGTYTVLCSFISYETKSVENITITDGSVIDLNFSLGESTVEIEDVKVVAKANRESESMLLLEQKNSLVATQTIGAQEISRKGVSDAEGAVTKVSGISKQEGVKNVFVRGLGDRFNTTSLNGFPVPSEDPEYKNISLDFFSSDIIKAVDVNKVFNSEMTGDVGGAGININSKELVGNSELKIDVSTSANSETYDKDFLIPDGISNFGFAQNTNSPMSGETYAFSNSLDPLSQSFQLGKSVGFSGGKRYEVGANHNPLTFYLIGSYSSDFSFRDGITRQTTTNGTIYRDQSTKEYETESLHFGMANLTYRFNKYNLTYNLLAIHTAKGGLRDDFGMDGNPFNGNSENNYSGLVRRQQNNDNTLLVYQLRVNREINKRLSADAGVAFNYTVGKEPDRRVNYLTYLGDKNIEPLKGEGYHHRYFGELKERDLNANAKVVYKLTDDTDNISSVEVGYIGRFLTDEYNASAWDNNWSKSLPQLDLDNFSLDEIFNQEGYAAGNFINKNYKTYRYTVSKMVQSVYSQLNCQLGQNLVTNFGIKADDVHIDLDYDLDVKDQTPAKTNSIDKFYILPSLNLKYSLNEKNALRLGASRTYTLPQSKEISPMLYEGSQWSSQGNKDLVPSINYNVDLKWDFYLTAKELISVTAFGKLIQKPISKVEINAANGYLSYANIAEEAKLAGVEVEIRKNIFSILNEEGSDTKNRLSTGINFSYISTGVELSNKSGNLPLDFTNEKTELEGASPYLANADITYQYKTNDVDMTTSVVVNYFSDRIYSVGVGGYKDVEENGLTTIDFISSFKIKHRWGIKIKAKNLLDPEFQLTRKPSGEDAEAVVLSSYKKGISCSLGLSYEF
ncbi:TonB-dependent receptor domain-containing protein [Sunxiuqinia sp. A32]|uniref:TonB-dependent receptor domain-containing protein n=1 Tax=Sunxiuqinia sp. A32 TaxID=3461496 RepID=UPI0040454818